MKANKKKCWQFIFSVSSFPSTVVRWLSVRHRLGKCRWIRWVRMWFWVGCLHSWPSVRADAHSDLWPTFVTFADALPDWRNRDFAILSRRQTTHRIFSPDSSQSVAQSPTDHRLPIKFENFDTKCDCPWMWMWWHDRKMVAISDDASARPISVWTILSAAPNMGLYRNSGRTRAADVIRTNSCRSISVRPACAHFPRGIWPTDLPAHSKTTRTNPVCDVPRTAPICCSVSWYKFRLRRPAIWRVPFSIRHDGVASVYANHASNGDHDGWCRERQIPARVACWSILSTKFELMRLHVGSRWAKCDWITFFGMGSSDIRVAGNGTSSSSTTFLSCCFFAATFFAFLAGVFLAVVFFTVAALVGTVLAFATCVAFTISTFVTLTE